MGSSVSEAAGPRVSVVILSYNHEDHIVESIRSVLDQVTSVAFEVVVADDASPDSTRRLVDEAFGGDPRVVVLPTPHNLGMQANLRRALDASRGEYVALLEGDDHWSDPTKLQRQTDYLDARPECSAVGGLTVVDDGVGRGELFNRALDGRTSIDVAATLRGTFPHISALMFRSEAFPTSPPWFDGLPAADWLLCNLLARHGDIGVIREVMSTYRKNPQSTWTPRPQLERKLGHLAGVEALGANVPDLGPEYRRALATAHRTVAAVALADGRRRLAAKHTIGAFRAAPGVMLRSGATSIGGKLRRR